MLHHFTFNVHVGNACTIILRLNTRVYCLFYALNQIYPYSNFVLYQITKKVAMLKRDKHLFTGLYIPFAIYVINYCMHVYCIT